MRRAKIKLVRNCFLLLQIFELLYSFVYYKGIFRFLFCEIYKANRNNWLEEIICMVRSLRYNYFYACIKLLQKVLRISSLKNH